MTRRQTPRQKKARDLARRVDMFGENQKSSRKNIPRRRAKLERAYRRRVHLALTRQEDADSADIRREPMWKWPGPTLAEALEMKHDKALGCGFSDPSGFRAGFLELMAAGDYYRATTEARHHSHSKNKKLAGLARLFLAQICLAEGPDAVPPWWRWREARANLAKLDIHDLSPADQELYRHLTAKIRELVLRIAIDDLLIAAPASGGPAGVVVRCPGCGARGTVRITRRQIDFRCKACNFCRKESGRGGLRYPHTGFKLEDGIPTLVGFEIWASVRTKHGVLWAYNEYHLAQLQALVAPETSRAVAEKVVCAGGLPLWIAQPANRDEATKALAKLQKLLAV